MQMIQKIFAAVKDVPEYIRGAWEHHMILVIILAALFIFITFFSNKVAKTLRTLFVIASLIFAAYGFLSRDYVKIWVPVAILVVLLAIRLFINGIRAIRQNRIDRRIEQRALEKAAKRRGSWKNRQGYSGEQHPIVDDYIPEKMNLDEIIDVLKNEVSEDSNIREETLESIGEIPDAEPSAAAEPKKEAETAAEDQKGPSYQETDDD